MKKLESSDGFAVEFDQGIVTFSEAFPSALCKQDLNPWDSSLGVYELTCLPFSHLSARFFSSVYVGGHVYRRDGNATSRAFRDRAISFYNCSLWFYGKGQDVEEVLKLSDRSVVQAYDRFEDKKGYFVEVSYEDQDFMGQILYLRFTSPEERSRWIQAFAWTISMCKSEKRQHKITQKRRDASMVANRALAIGRIRDSGDFRLSFQGIAQMQNRPPQSMRRPDSMQRRLQKMLGNNAIAEIMQLKGKQGQVDDGETPQESEDVQAQLALGPVRVFIPRSTDALFHVVRSTAYTRIYSGCYELNQSLSAAKEKLALGEPEEALDEFLRCAALEPLCDFVDVERGSLEEDDFRLNSMLFFAGATKEEGKELPSTAS